MDFSTFQGICSDEKRQENKFLERHRALKHAQENVYGSSYRPKYKFLRGAFCPACGKPLTVEDFTVGALFIFHCDCGYEYADAVVGD